MFRNFALFLMIGFIACSSSDSPHINVENVWSWPVEAMTDEEGNSHSTGVVYMTLVNKGAEDHLISVSSEVSEVVELHNTKTDGDRMMMQRIEGYLQVPANGGVEFKPGGLHIMLIGLKRSLNPGEQFELLLEFEKSGEMNVASNVRQP